MASRNRVKSLRGDRLKDLRKRQKMSQEELADQVKTTRQQISRYEKGKSEPAADMLARLASALDCSADYLLGAVSEQTGYGPEIDPETIKLARELMQFPQTVRDALFGIAQTMKHSGDQH